MEGEDTLVTSVNVPADLPSQLNDPIRIEPIRTLIERLPSPTTDFFVALEEPTHTVSGVFLQHPEDHVHIIVTVKQPLGKCK
jgi:hypothetical protein